MFSELPKRCHVISLMCATGMVQFWNLYSINGETPLFSFFKALPTVDQQNILSSVFRLYLFRSGEPRHRGKVPAHTMDARSAESSEHDNVMSIYMHNDDNMDCWYWGGWQSDLQKYRFRGGGLGGREVSLGIWHASRSMHEGASGVRNIMALLLTGVHCGRSIRLQGGSPIKVEAAASELRLRHCRQPGVSSSQHHHRRVLYLYTYICINKIL